MASVVRKYARALYLPSLYPFQFPLGIDARIGDGTARAFVLLTVQNKEY